jgi:small nuclear ribonucleoprotein
LSADVSLKILQKSLGSTVLVRLRNGKVLRGLLKGYDQHMNIVLEDTDELVGGKHAEQAGDNRRQGGQHRHDIPSLGML